MNKITWFTKQLQHKTNAETLKLSPDSDEYILSMEKLFALDCYVGEKPSVCEVLKDSDAAEPEGRSFYANIARGIHYRLQVNGQVVLFKITTRKIWFFVDVDNMLADLAVDTWTGENVKNK